MPWLLSVALFPFSASGTTRQALQALSTFTLQHFTGGGLRRPVKCQLCALCADDHTPPGCLCYSHRGGHRADRKAVCWPGSLSFSARQWLACCQRFLASTAAAHTSTSVGTTAGKTQGCCCCFCCCCCWNLLFLFRFSSEWKLGSTTW